MNMLKVNYPELSLFYINQGYLTVKKTRERYLCRLYNSCPNKIDVKTVKSVLPKYDPKTGEFLGIEEMIGFINVRSDSREGYRYLDILQL